MNKKNWLSKNLTSLLRTSLCLVASILGVSFASANTLGVDTSFLPPSFAKATPPERALLLSDGKYFLYFDPDTLTDPRTGALTRFLPDGTFDTTFSFNRDYKTVTAVAPAGNGQYYVSATKYVYGAVDAEQILRVNSDGSIDPTFAPATVGSPNALPDVQQILVQPDGRVLVAGTFQTFAGNAARDGIVRLLTDGTVDSSFAPVTITGFVYSVALQDDGKVLIGGTLSNVNGVSTVGIVRLNSNGSLDSSFQGTGFARNLTSSRIRKIVVQPDGLILISGALRVNPSSPTKRMAVMRVTATGAFDSTFDSSTVTSTLNTGRDIVRQPDGTVVAVINNSVYRLNSNGSKDGSFRQPVILDATLNPASSGTPVTLQLYSDGRMLLGGIFTDVDQSGSPNYAHFGVVRLDSSGNVDSSLGSSRRTGNETVPSSFTRLSDGSTLATFADLVDPAIPYNVARLLSDGSRDSSFTLSSSDPNRFLNGFSARGIVPLPDGNFFVFGIGTDQGPHYGKVRPNGTEDTSFATNSGVTCQNAAILPNGKIFTVGETDAQSALFSAASLLNADGQIVSPGGPYPDQIVRDPSTGMLIEMNVGTHVVAIQPNNKILLLRFTNDRRFHFIRLNDDGSLDGSFSETQLTPPDAAPSFPVVFDPFKGTTLQPPNGVWSAPYSIQDAHVQQDGSIIVVGRFTSFGNTTVRSVAKLKPDGTIDNTFNAGGGAQWVSLTETATLLPTVENIEAQPDGKFLITGNFEAFNGVPAPGIAQLNADGSVDTSFVAPVHRDKRSRITTSAFKAQPDGSFLLSGPYAFTGESTTRSLIRLINLQPGAVNISTRLGVGTGDDALIEGFIVQGPAGSSKKIMVRAIGPSLAQFGIADALQNPTLEIHDASGNTVATNNDWKITQTGGLITGNQFAEINGSGLAPTNDLESAVIVSLTPGSYTAVVRGVGNSVGTGVVDAFDLDAGSTARVANIATRGVVQPGDKLMIAGFIVQNGAVKVVVRGIGPSLLQFGISNALPDTTLQLRNQQGAIVLENDDWKSSQQKELEDLNLQPTNDLEAALVTTIQPGQYTAQLRGKNNDSGIGVVQVYFLQ